MRLVALLVVACAYFFSSSATAQLFDDNVAREQAVKNAKQLENLAGALREISKKTNNLEKQNATLRKRMGTIAQKIQGIDEKLRGMRGLIEEHAENYKSQAQGKSQEDVILGKRLDDLTQKISAVEKELLDMSEYVNLPSEQELYDAAFASFQRREYDDSIKGFQRILKLYPDGKFNANAEYWSGLALLNSAEYEAAAAAARNLIERYSDSNKVPDAKLVLARALKSLQNEEKAKKVLSDIVREYPTSLAADKARQLLVE